MFVGPPHHHDGPRQRRVERLCGGEWGDRAYENVSAHIRDLIRRDKERVEQQAFERLKAELVHAFSAQESSYRQLSAAEVIARNWALPDVRCAYPGGSLLSP